MAHLAKFTAPASSCMYDHWERRKNQDGQYITYKTEDEKGGHIDRSKTDQNFTIGTIRPKEWIKKRLKGVYQKPNQKHPIQTCDIVVTLPQNESKDLENVQKFMNATYDTLTKLYGKNDNVIGCWVHMDEAQPHLHFAFLPISERISKQKPEFKEKLSTRAYWPKKSSLQDMHKILQREMDAAMGHHVEITNGITKYQGGNKTIVQLKTESQKLQKELDEHQQQSKEEMDKLVGIHKKPLFGNEHYELTPAQYQQLRKLAQGSAQKDASYSQMRAMNEHLTNENQRYRERLMRSTEEIREEERKNFANEISRTQDENVRLKRENRILKERTRLLAAIPPPMREHAKKRIEVIVNEVQELWHTTECEILRTVAETVEIVADGNYRVASKMTTIQTALRFLNIPDEQHEQICNAYGRARHEQIHKGRAPKQNQKSWGRPDPNEIDYRLNESSALSWLPIDVLDNLHRMQDKLGRGPRSEQQRIERLKRQQEVLRREYEREKEKREKTQERNRGFSR